MRTRQFSNFILLPFRYNLDIFVFVGLNEAGVTVDNLKVKTETRFL